MSLRWFVVALLIGCSSNEGGTTNGTDSGVATDASDASADAVSDVAKEVASEVGTACVVKRAPKTADCAEDCDARLFLPGGDAYCTFTCTKNEECTPAGADLIRSTETGTCMPKCTANDSCTAAGFKRCDTTVGACDTI